MLANRLIIGVPCKNDLKPMQLMIDSLLNSMKTQTTEFINRLIEVNLY